MRRILTLSRHITRNNIVGFQRMLSSRETVPQGFTKKKSQLVSERDLDLGSVSNDPDVFGTLAKDRNIFESYDLEDEYDEKLKKYEETRTALSKPHIKEYATMIKSYLKERKLRQAIQVLETKMLLEDNVKPDQYIYNLLIVGCGREGYTEKAFKLFNNMKKRALKPSPHTYTGLFNACANSPFPTESLERARDLRQLMIEKGYVATTLNYHSMIKAFGRCGDINTSFELVDEMIREKLTVSSETIAFLLQACVTNKENGFMQALMVWRKMRQMKIRPTEFTYNLMIRCVRDCGVDKKYLQVGSNVNLLEKLLEVPLPKIKETKLQSIESSETQSYNDTLPLLTSDGHMETDTEIQTYKQPTAVQHESLPNLLGTHVASGNLVALESLDSHKNRMLLLGGINGILQNMKMDRVPPNIKTFTQLLDIIPSTTIAENDLISLMKEYSLNPDLDFLNLLIKRRNFRRDFQDAKDVLNLIQEYRYSPDIVTFGVLALGCPTMETAKKFLTELEEAGFRLNEVILNSLVKNACFSADCTYIIYTMNVAKHHEITPDTKTLEILENFRLKTKKLMNEKEQGKVVKGRYTSKYFQKGWKTFSLYYPQWLRKMKVDLPVHPWAQFRQE